MTEAIIGFPAAPPDTADHYHVLAVQDWGGSQERWSGWDDPLSRGEAEGFARDMAEADRLVMQEATPDSYETAERQFRPRYGDDWHKLVSGNVAPGWDAIFIDPCRQPCDWGPGWLPVTAPWWKPGS